MSGQSDAAIAALSRPPRLPGRDRRGEARLRHDVLIAIVRSGVTASRLERLAEIIPVPPCTVARWCAWWRDRFTATPFWQAARARFMPPVVEPLLPAALLERFVGDACDQLLALLRFLGPLTGGRPR